MVQRNKGWSWAIKHPRRSDMAARLEWQHAARSFALVANSFGLLKEPELAWLRAFVDRAEVAYLYRQVALWATQAEIDSEAALIARAELFRSQPFYTSLLSATKDRLDAVLAGAPATTPDTVPAGAPAAARSTAPAAAPAAAHAAATSFAREEAPAAASSTTELEAVPRASES